MLVEKAASEQMQVLVEKWMSESANCSFQHYFYNSVPADHVPYYTPPNGEDAKKWEEALASKPFEGSIPVLAKGFPSLAQRLGTQVRAVAALQARLHEMNDSLTALLNNHDLSISTRTLEAKRKQVGLSQRCLSLAAKVQILRNKGYMMDSAEDNLSKRLLQLQFDSFDPVLKGRTEQIWAKLIDIREVMRIAQQNAGSNKGNGEDKVFPLDEDTLRIAKEVRQPLCYPLLLITQNRFSMITIAS